MAFGEDNVLGEVEDVATGDSEELSLDLEPGSYVLLCNVVEEPGEMEMEPGTSFSHFANGMQRQLHRGVVADIRDLYQSVTFCLG